MTSPELMSHAGHDLIVVVTVKCATCNVVLLNADDAHVAVVDGGIPVQAPRFHDGVKLGYYPAVVVQRLPAADDDPNPPYLLRFPDGHQAAAFRRELRAGASNWKRIDQLDKEANA